MEQSNHKDSEIATLRERQRRTFRFSTRRYREGSRNDNWAFFYLDYSNANASRYNGEPLRSSPKGRG
ncbi:MAG: hypothetical protein V7K40_20030 [Nostoc sp.]|uniref:hypothetical protein n=1 Tax=Nostoc sp. TaxID=1180 RepID=UPI002FFA3185